MIIGALIFALATGYRRGFWLSLAQYVGLLLGVIIGAAVAPPIVQRLQINTPDAKSVGAVLILVVGGLLGSTIGYWVGEPIRARLLARPGAWRYDAVVGAIFSGIAVLSVSWFLGLSFDRSVAAPLIQRSTILRRLDAIAPRPPGFLARVETLLAGVRFPSAFSGLEPLFQQPYPIPSSVDTAGVRAAEAVTIKVESFGCGGIVYGSGFPVAPGEFLTNAHVVAGTHDSRIIFNDGTQYRARVVLFDPQTDVAVLRVQGLKTSPLTMAPAGPGTQGAAIGYPGGSGEQVSPAVIETSFPAQGRDIYGQSLVTRQIWVAKANVVPGNSGGPLVDLDGHVVGVVFAASTDPSSQAAYALTDEQVQPDVAEARDRSLPTDVGQCAL